MKAPSLTIGIEEEYQIIDPDTRELRSYITQILDEGRLFLREQVKPELHQSIVEVGSSVCQTPAGIRDELVRLRGIVMNLAGKSGLKIAAAGTHPFSSWMTQEITPLERYSGVKQDMQELAQRLLIFGTHVHIGIEDREFLIDAHIPWTCRVEHRHASYHDQAIDLIPYIVEHRENLVLKPNDEYGGKGIVLGWQTGAAGWEQAIRTALSEPYIVQERVAIPSEPYPSLVDGRLELTDRMLDTNPFVFYGDYVDGCLSRLSAEALLNVSAGTGSAVATFVVEKR